MTSVSRRAGTEAAMWLRLLDQEMGSLKPARGQSEAARFSRQRSQRLSRFFQAALSHSDVSGMIEVGARWAGASRKFLERGEDRVAHAYEANPYVFAELLQRGIPPSLSLFREAIYDGSPEVQLRLRVDDRLGSNASVKRRRSKSGEFINVASPAISLGEAIKRMRNEDPGIGRIGLWIDAEGAAFDILSSSATSLSDHVAAIYVELEDADVWAEAGDALSVVDTLVDCGFIPVARDREHPFAFNLLALHAQTYKRIYPHGRKWLLAERDRLASGMKG